MKILLVVVASVGLCFSSFGQIHWRLYHEGNSGLRSNRIANIAAGAEKSIWVAYAGAGGEGLGISLFKDSTWTHYDRSNSGLLNNDIRAMRLDKAGNMWFACYNAGLVKFDGTTWTTFTTTNSGLAANNVSSLHVDKDNVLWVGMYFGGVSKFNGSQWTTYTSSNAPFYPGSNCINEVTTDSQGNLWVGLGCGAGLAVLNKATNLWSVFNTNNSPLQYQSVSALIEDRQGSMWIGYPTNMNVISRIEGDVWKHTTPSDTTFHGVSYSGFEIDRNGKVLCGSSVNGLLQYNGVKWERLIGSLEETVSSFSQSVVIDTEGFAWYADQFKGLWTEGREHVAVPGATNVAGVKLNSSSVKLTWTAPQNVVINYAVQRRALTTPVFSTVATLPGTDLEYVDAGLNEGTTFQYRVKAQHAILPMNLSDSATVTTNHKPSALSFSRGVLQNDSLQFKPTDFSVVFSDADSGESLKQIEIKTLPDKGKLFLNRSLLSVPAIILVADLAKLIFISDATGDTGFTYHVNDGFDNSALSYTVFVSVIAPPPSPPGPKSETPVEPPSTPEAPVAVGPSVPTSPTPPSPEPPQVVTGIDDDTNAFGFELSPNPVIADLQITSAGVKEFSVRIIDATGKTMLILETTTGHITADLRTIRAGLYIVQATDASGARYMKRVIKGIRE